jgi:hypothetical protein
MAFQQQLLAAIGDEHGTEAANRLCEACVALFEVDAAAISVVFDGINKGTLGASGPPARVYDELGEQGRSGRGVHARVARPPA